MIFLLATTSLSLGYEERLKECYIFRKAKISLMYLQPESIVEPLQHDVLGE